MFFINILASLCRLDVNLFVVGFSKCLSTCYWNEVVLYNLISIIQVYLCICLGPTLGFIFSSQNDGSYYTWYNFCANHIDLNKRRYRVCPIIHCCSSTTPYWITAPPILFYLVPCKEGHLCACNTMGKHQPLVKRNISFESYEWVLFIWVALFTNSSGFVRTIVLWRCQKVMRTSWILLFKLCPSK